MNMLYMCMYMLDMYTQKNKIDSNNVYTILYNIKIIYMIIDMFTPLYILTYVYIYIYVCI